MSQTFFSTLAGVSGTMASILASLVVAYVIYLKRKRDAEGVNIIQEKRIMNTLFHNLMRIPIPGIIAHLLSEPERKPEEIRGLDKVVRWLAGTEWWRLAHGKVTPDMALRAQRDILDGLIEMADQVVGIPEDWKENQKIIGMPPLEQDSPSFRGWAEKFLNSTWDFAWLWETYGEFGWGRKLMALLMNLEKQKLGSPSMRSGNVSDFFNSLIKLRTLVEEILFKEERYQSYKLEIGLRHRRWIGLGFISMSIFGIIVPLLTLLPVSSSISLGWQIDTFVIALTCLVGFLASLSAATCLILKSVSP